MNDQESPNNDKTIEQLIDEYGDVLFGYALSRLRRHDLAEDAVQETFIAANDSLAGFSGKSSYKVWLIGILRHKIIDYLRKKSNIQQDQAVELTDDFFDKAGHWVNKPKSWASDPAKIMEDQSFWQTLEKCLSNLSEPVAQAFVLRVMEEFGPDIVCDNLQITPTNLWNRLHRARLQLRQCLEVNWFIG